jgi:hypothetical protein
MKLALANKHGMTCNSKKPTWTAVYAIDQGVTLSFRFIFDATLQCMGLLPDKVLCDLAGGMFSAVPSSSEISLAEEGDVNIAL